MSGREDADLLAWADDHDREARDRDIGESNCRRFGETAWADRKAAEAHRHRETAKALRERADRVKREAARAAERDAERDAEDTGVGDGH